MALAPALSQPWQFGILAVTAVGLIAFKRGVVTTLLAAAIVGRG